LGLPQLLTSPVKLSGDALEVGVECSGDSDEDVDAVFSIFS
jgi:hypothetical protein